MISNVGKDQLVKTLRARLQWLVLEAGEEEYNEEEVSTIVDTLSVLDPIELPGTYFTPEEAFKRFWRNQERMREAEARESGKIYINSLEKNGFWEEVQECEDVESGAEQSEDIKNKTEGTKRDSEVGMGSRSAGTEKDLSVETAKQSDDPTELFQKLKTEYWKNKPGEQGEVREQETSGAEQAKPALGLVYHAISEKSAAADRKASEEWDMLDDMEELEELQMLQDTMSAVSSPAEKAKSVSTDIEELLKHLELLKKSGVDLEQIKEILLEEKRKQQDMSKRGIKKVCKKRRWTKGTTRVAVAAVLVLGIGMGSAIGVYAGKGGFFHWRKNNEEKVAGLVSSMDSSVIEGKKLSYSSLNEVDIKYLRYLWLPQKLDENYKLQQINIYDDLTMIKTEMRYVSEDSVFIDFIRSTYEQGLVYTDKILDKYKFFESREFGDEIVVNYFEKENNDYTEYIMQFNYLNSIYSLNTNLTFEEVKVISEILVEDLNYAN